MRYLITGGMGFIGSHLCEALLDEGHEVTLIDNLSTGSFANVKHLESRCTCVVDTILNRPRMETLVAKADIIVHLAASVGVKHILAHQVETMRSDLEGTALVLDLAARYKCRVLLTSSSEVYGRADQKALHEHDTLRIEGPTAQRWVYASVKITSEFMAMSYHREAGIPVVVCRLFNVVGPRQKGRYGMVLPRFVRQALTHQPITVYGDGTQRRSFTHVSDCVWALRTLSHHPEAAGRVFNIGSENDLSINDLAHLVRDSLDSRSPITHTSYEEAYGCPIQDVAYRCPDISQLTNLTGFSPRHNAQDMVRDVASYIRAVL